MKPLKVKGKFRDWQKVNPDGVETTPKKKINRNFVTVTLVLKNKDTWQGRARDILFHDMDGDIVVDWLDEKPLIVQVANIESFMVTR